MLAQKSPGKCGRAGHLRQRWGPFPLPSPESSPTRQLPTCGSCSFYFPPSSDWRAKLSTVTNSGPPPRKPPRPACSITAQVPSLGVTPPPSLLLGPGLFSSPASPAAHSALLGTPWCLQVAGFVCPPEGLPQAAGNGRRHLVSRPGCQSPPMVGGAPLTLAPTSVPLDRVSPASTPLKGSAHPSPRSRGEAGLRVQEPLDGR